MGVAGDPDDRRGRVAGQGLPGLIDPGDSELGVEPEKSALAPSARAPRARNGLALDGA